MAIIGGGKLGAGSADAEAQDLAGVGPVGTGADVDLEEEMCELHDF